MKKNYLIGLGLLLIGLCTIGGCKKEQAKFDSSKCKVVSTIEPYSKYIYEYDSYGRLAKQSIYDMYGSIAGYEKFNYSYGRCVIERSDGSFDTVQLSASGLYLAYKGTSYYNQCYFNAYKQIDSIVLRQGNTTRILFTCTYNTDGDLIELKAYDSYHIWYKETFTYSDEENYFNYCPKSLFWTGGWGPMPIEDLKFHSNWFYGNTISKHLPIEIETQQYDFNTGAIISTSSSSYTYTKDVSGKIVTISSNYQPSNTTLDMQVEYSCTN